MGEARTAEAEHASGAPLEEPTQAAILCETVGATLVAPAGFDLRGVCVKCGRAQAPVDRRASLGKTPFWVHLTLISCIPWIILLLVARRRSSHRVSLCRPCARAWRLSRIAEILLLPLLTVVILGAPLTLEALGDAPLVIFAALAFLVWWLIPWAMARHRLTLAKLEDDYAHLQGASPEYVRAMGIPAADPYG